MVKKENNMPINYELAKDIINRHNKFRNAFVYQFKVEDRPFQALVFDQNMPMTTNRRQLETIGIDCSNPHENLDEIIEGLKIIGIALLTKNMPKSEIADRVKLLIEDNVHENWSSEEMIEVIDLDPNGRWLCAEDIQEKKDALGESSFAFLSKESTDEIIEKLS